MWGGVVRGGVGRVSARAGGSSEGWERTKALEDRWDTDVGARLCRKVGSWVGARGWRESPSGTRGDRVEDRSGGGVGTADLERPR